MKSTACVEQSILTFDCPYGNGDPLVTPTLRNTTLHGGQPLYRTRCRVCGIAVQLNDTDPRPGYIAGNISFGPNALDGYVDEGPVTGYDVYFVDGCGLPIGLPVATVPKREGVVDYCCQADAYLAEVTARVPWNSDRLVIVPVTSAGPLSVGELTDFISDWVVNATVAIARSSSAVTSALPSWSLASVAFAAVASLLTSRG